MRQNPTETVAVEMEQSKVCEKAEFVWEKSGDVAVVQVDSGDDLKFWVVERWGTVYSKVAAN